MVLTEGDLDQIENKVHEITMESWNKVEDHYGKLITSVLDMFAELNILALSVRQLEKIKEGVTKGSPIEPTLATRLT